MSITVTFDPPVPSDSVSTFNSKAFATLGDLNTWSTQANALASAVNSDASTASTASTTATTQAGIATTQAGTATTAAGTATTQAGLAVAAYDAFDDRYLGSKTSDPTLDNDGNALLTGALYWNSVASEMRVYSGVAWAAAYLAVSGFRDIPQNSQSTAYTLVLGDAGKHILHPSADTTARVFTIPANSSVAFPIGTAITFVNQASAGVVTISITTDTMRLAGAGTTGSRTLAANGVATALKITATEWIISGTGLT